MKNNLTIRRIPLSDTPNFRDLGGYATTNGGATRFGVFYRSACPRSLSKDDKTYLAKLNVTTAIDLRGGNNAEETQRAFVADGITVCGIAIGNNELPKCAAEVPAGYMEIAEHPNIANVFKTLADCSGAAVFHCFAGKDRTGVVAALLLMLAGVADEDIIADYTLTYAYYLKRLRQYLLQNDVEKNIIRPLPEHMESFLNMFRQKHGTARDYMLSIGVTEQQIDNIINKFVTNNGYFD